MNDPTAVRKRIDELCNQFEEDWTPNSPSFAKFLDQIVDTRKHDLLTALLEVDVELRLKFGLQVCAEDYEHLGEVAVEQVQRILAAPSAGDDATMTATPPRKTRSAPSRQIGPFKLLQKIGEGGMGTVWMADQLKPVKRRVALKVIKPGMDSKQVMARFEAERQALAMMDHQNIAKVLDAGMTEEGCPTSLWSWCKASRSTSIAIRTSFRSKSDWSCLCRSAMPFNMRIRKGSSIAT